ncbi:hypothetical protein [Paenibacillus aestuarii]|uniref:Uncharacterized protein n=1 Tax=Paenibacillus aestuarii TaxID=516965 RepID=A0ABW0K8E9_9BACL|nr:hypothetical protein [Paenibacillus aestuarii]
MTTLELVKSQDEAQKKNNDSMRPKSYYVGYPDREMIKEYASRYKKLDESIAAKILNDYCTRLKIKNAKRFSEDVILAIFSNSNPPLIRQNEEQSPLL